MITQSHIESRRRKQTNSNKMCLPGQNACLFCVSYLSKCGRVRAKEEDLFAEGIGKLSSNKKEKQLNCICIFRPLPFQMLLSSQWRGGLCRAFHAELLNEFFFMKAGGEMRLPVTPIFNYWSVIVPRARQLLLPAPKWKDSSACIFKEDFDWSKIKQWQNIQTELNEKALDSFLHIGRKKKSSETDSSHSWIL